MATKTTMYLLGGGAVLGLAALAAAGGRRKKKKTTRPAPPPPPPGPVEPAPPPAGPRPWEIVGARLSPEPMPGFLYRVQATDTGGVYRLAGRALANFGIPDPENQNGVRVNRMTYAGFMECSPWNDALVNGPDKGAKRGPNNRGINLNAQHADNLARMNGGQAPTADGLGHLPLIWFPALEAGAPQPILANWTDGRSGINPPVDILDFELEGVAPGAYGCDPWAATEGQFA